MWENAVYFDLIEKKDLLVIAEEKDVRFYDLNHIIGKHSDNPQEAISLKEEPFIYE